jgi:hypothetical protein
MKKDYLRYILSVLTQDFETLATSEQVTEFKKKHCGVKWQNSLEKDLLNYANNVFTLERWIGNVVTFMMEHNIYSSIKINNKNNNLK